jgi:hypothetical protein
MAALQNTNQAQIVDASLIQMKINDLPDNDDLSISSQDKVESVSQ